MVEYNTVNAKLSNSQLNKLKSAAKKQGKTLRMNARMVSANNLPYELFLTTRQTTKLRNAIESNISANIKLSKAQISKIIQSGGFLGYLIGPLLKTGLTLLKSVSSIRLTASLAIDEGVLKNIYVSGSKTLVISNDNIQDVLIIVKSLEISRLLLNGVTKTIHNNISEQKRGFLSMLLGTLGTSLLGNILK